MALKKISSGPGALFKPEEHAQALVILVEPDRFQPDVPVKKRTGQTVYLDTVYGDVTVFPNEAALNGKADPTEFKGTNWFAAALVGGTKDHLKDQLALNLEQYTNKSGGKSWRFVNNEDEVVLDKLEKWIERRDAGQQAEGSDFPEF